VVTDSNIDFSSHQLNSPDEHKQVPPPGLQWLRCHRRQVVNSQERLLSATRASRASTEVKLIKGQVEGPQSAEPPKTFSKGLATEALLCL